MKIITKGKLTIDGEDSTISGYTFNCEGESMLSATIFMLEEGVRDLQAQIEKAKVEGINISDGGNNQLNGESWEFPFGVKACLTGDPSPDIRWFDNYADIRSLEIGHDQTIQISRINEPTDQ